MPTPQQVAAKMIKRGQVQGRAGSVSPAPTAGGGVDWTKKLGPEFHLDQGIEQLKKDAPLGEAWAQDVENGDDRDPILDDLAETVAQVRSNAESIIKRAQLLRANELKTQLARERDVMRLADQRSAVALPTIDRGRALAQKRIGELLASTIPPDTKHGAEIRAVLRGSDRGHVDAAIKAGDATTMGAILNAPAIVSGLDPASYDNVLARWREAAHPKTMRRVARAQRAIDLMDRAGSAYLLLTTTIVDRKAVKEAEEREAAAQRALADD